MPLALEEKAQWIQGRDDGVSHFTVSPFLALLVPPQKRRRRGLLSLNYPEVGDKPKEDIAEEEDKEDEEDDEDDDFQLSEESENEMETEMLDYI